MYFFFFIIIVLLTLYTFLNINISGNSDYNISTIVENKYL